MKNNKINPKQLARLLFVQTIYALNIHDNKVKNISTLSSEILKSFKEKELHLELGIENNHYLTMPDETLYFKLIHDFTNQKLDQETIIKKYLKSSYKIENLDLLLLCILISGIFEIQYCGDTATNIILDDYVTITTLFYDNKEIGFINAILDAISKDIRSINIQNKIDDNYKSI